MVLSQRYAHLALPCAALYQSVWFHIWSCDGIGPSGAEEPPAAGQGFASGADETHLHSLSRVSDEWP